MTCGSGRILQHILAPWIRERLGVNSVSSQLPQCCQASAVVARTAYILENVRISMAVNALLEGYAKPRKVGQGGYY